MKLKYDKIITQHFKKSTFDYEDSRASRPNVLEDDHIHVILHDNELKFGTSVHPGMGKLVNIFFNLYIFFLNL